MDDFLNIEDAKRRLVSELALVTGFKCLKSGALKKA